VFFASFTLRPIAPPGAFRLTNGPSGSTVEPRNGGHPGISDYSARQQALRQKT
jgi:hypothetical protein